MATKTEDNQKFPEPEDIEDTDQEILETSNEEENEVEAPAEPSSDTQIYTMKSQIGHERTASERLADRVRRSGAPIFSILAPFHINHIHAHQYNLYFPTQFPFYY